MAAKRPKRRKPPAVCFSEGEWNHAVTRQIALDETAVDGAALCDQLAGAKLRMLDPDVRDLYRQRCVKRAAHAGHRVPKPDQIPNGEDTTVMEVGDALYEKSVH